ncbi:MAG: DUF4190 domain-containing protein [Bryobacteraceae bacterium]|nr:DUF4190 domain-containing protein [Bryobacteraceae bacterium]
MMTAPHLLTSAVACLGCGQALPLAELSQAEGARCPRCRAQQWGQLFPAAFRPPAKEGAANLLAAGDAACFHHPTKQAVVPCDRCGRFLCSLCRFAVGQQSLCPTCIDLGRREAAGRWVPRRTNLDTVALACATLPLLLVSTSIIGAPIGIYLGLRALRQPAGPLPRGRWRAILAIVLGIVQVLAWLGLLLTLIGTWLFPGGRLG